MSRRPWVQQYLKRDKLCRYLGLSLALAAMAYETALAKRRAPNVVAPVLYDGKRFEAPNRDGRTAYLQAWDDKTGQKLWEVPVFVNLINPLVEEDVQWVFVKGLAVQNGRLIVTDEKGRSYSVDPQTGRVLSPGLWPLAGFPTKTCIIVLLLAIGTAFWKRRR